MRAALAVIFALSPLLAAPVRADEALSAAVAEDYEFLGGLYRHFHTNPELSFQETESAARLAEEWRSLGFEVTEDVGQTGVVAVMENGEGPTVMLRADMDALPVEEQTGLEYASTATGETLTGEEAPVMHACGHDVHMTSLVGTARRLAARREDWSGTLVLIAQPAEEIGLGALAMLDDGLYERFPRPDYVVGLHVSASLPTGQVGYVSGYALANVDSVDIEVRGIGGHGAYPHATRDPVVLSAQIVMALQTLVSRETSPLDSAVVTVGSIHGGTKHNIIGESVHMQLTVRSYADETRERLLNGIRRIAHAQAQSAGLPEELWPSVTWEEQYTPSTYNDPELNERVVAAIGAQIGAENVVEVDPVMAGEDFSQYGRTDPAVPAVIFWLGAVNTERYESAAAAGESLPSLHSPLFAPDPEPTITTGVEAMTAAALDLFAGEG